MTDWEVYLQNALLEFEKKREKSADLFKKEDKQSVYPIVYITFMNDQRRYGPTVEGDLVVKGTMENAFNTINQIQSSYGDNKTDLASRLDTLHTVVTSLLEELPEERRKKVSRDLRDLIEEASSEEPRKDFLQITSKGLVEAAKTAARMAAPVAEAVQKVLEFFPS